MRRGMISTENWIASLPQRVQAVLAEHWIEENYSAGEEIRSAGEMPDGMIQVLSGYVRLHALQKDGRQLLITIYGAGNSYAETAVVGRRPLHHTSSALTHVCVRRMPIEAFWTLYATHPEIPEALCRKFANALSWQIAAREMRASKGLAQCIALLLQHASEICGKSYVDGVEITCPFTQQDLADHLDVTRQSIQREIRELKRVGLIRRTGRRWLIRNDGSLASFCAA